MAQVVSGFPGVGKSWLKARMLGVKDSDSSAFSWAPSERGEPKKRNPYWPDNYIQYIRYHLDHPDTTYILVSSHQEVRDALVQAGIPFLLVYPSPGIKQEYIQRYLDRGNTGEFVRLLDVHWDKWIAELQAQTGCEHRVLQAGQYLADVLPEIPR